MIRLKLNPSRKRLFDAIMDYEKFVNNVGTFLKFNNFEQVTNEAKKELIDEILIEYLNEFLSKFSTERTVYDDTTPFVNALRETSTKFYLPSIHSAIILLFTNYICYLMGNAQNHAIFTSYHYDLDADFEMIPDYEDNKISNIRISLNSDFIGTFETLYDYLWDIILPISKYPTTEAPTIPHY